MRLWLLLGCLCLSGASLQVARAQDSITMSLDGETPSESSLPKAVQIAEPGPWGILEYYEIPLACPDSSISLIGPPSQQTEWVFEVGSVDEVREQLTASGMSEAHIAELLAPRQLAGDDRGIRVFPSSEIVSSLEPKVRSRLYASLARSQHNRFYRRPVYISTSNLSRWARGTNLPDSVLSDMAKLAYPTPSGRGYFLSDVSFLMRLASNAQDERTLLKAVFTSRTLMVRLRLGENADPEALAEYWSGGYKHKDILPMFESIAESNLASSLDVAHLLPPNARMRLNTHPSPAEGATGRFPDWFWTCFNFFRFNNREIYADSEDRDAALFSNFTPISRPSEFGDLIFLKSGEKWIHGCVYIAENIVYTKNGPDVFSPWVLMRLEDVIAYHDFTGNVSLEIFRKR